MAVIIVPGAGSDGYHNEPVIIVPGAGIEPARPFLATGF